MTREEAIKWMEETIQDAEGLLDKCSPALKEEVLEQNEVFKIAISALRSTPQPGKSLTLDQLREMDGQPVWIVEYPDWGHWELSEDANDYIVDRNLNFYGMKHDDPDGRYGLHKLGWLAYSYPPAHIDRGEWTAEWIYPENEWNLPRCSKCGCNSKDATYGHKNNFCPKCGRAMTPEAWAELERRLQRMPLPEPWEEG